MSKGTVFAKWVEWKTKRLKGSPWGHPMDWPLSPIDEARPLNFLGRKISGPYNFNVQCFLK